MTSFRTIPILVTTIILIVAIPTGLYFIRRPSMTLPPIEAELAKFINRPVNMASSGQQVRFFGLICPVTTPAQILTNNKVKPDAAKTVAPRALPAKIGNDKTQQPALRSLGSLPVVSVISYDGTVRTAIINNQIVTEGARVDGGLIVKIEETRVLMRKTGKDLWLTIQ